MGRSSSGSPQRVLDAQKAVDLAMNRLWNRGDTKVGRHSLVVGEHERAPRVRGDLFFHGRHGRPAPRVTFGSQGQLNSGE